ncbi:MAG: DUF2306 domain-containing protein [Alphaproteobacteria bacterium]|nr:DUF2306 domain-containing protein [Alphaproteobacteria bacterium]
MSDVAATAPSHDGFAHKALKTSGVIWFLAATVGQWLFVYYILMTHGRATLSGNYSEWDDVGLISGYVDGDLIANLLFISHVLLAVIMIVGGTLQLSPPVRKRFPTLHRWTGRVFLVIALFLAIGGYYMTWARGVRLSDIGAMGVSFNAHLIVFFSALTFYYAYKRQIDTHRRWAMRLFIVAHGVWFFRISLMGWYLINQGPVGSTRQLDGPADLVISFACYLVPLAMLELYQRAVDGHSTRFKWAMTVGVLLGTVAMSIGIFAALMMMWLPHI